MADDEDIAAMFAKDLATDREPKSSSFGSLGADKWSEDIVHLVRRNAVTIIDDFDASPFAIRFDDRSDADLWI